MSQTRIKICGITRPEDAASAAELGADFIGLNFFSGPRKIDFVRGEDILRAAEKRVFVVGLFWLDHLSKSASADGMIYCHNHLTARQVYGLLDELAATTPAFTSEIDRQDTWLPAPVSSRESISHIRHLLEMTKLKLGALLLDTASKAAQGGTGQTFNWHWIAEARAAGELSGLPPIILAGGLNPDNVAEAIRIAQPYAVDVSSGVEVAGKPGIKDPIKMRDFIQAVQGAH